MTFHVVHYFNGDNEDSVHSEIKKKRYPPDNPPSSG